MQGGVEPEHAAGELFLDLQRVVLFVDHEIAPEDLQNGKVRRDLAVRETEALEPGHRLPGDRAAELVDQT